MQDALWSVQGTFVAAWLWLLAGGQFLLPVYGHTYYVSTAGDDGNSGEAIAPWRTIGHAASRIVAGDTVIVREGDYAEHVRIRQAGGASAYITFKSEIPGAASLRAFRLDAPYIVVDGFLIEGFSGANNPWGAAVRIEAWADNCIVRNCTIANAPYVSAHDFSFDSSDNKIISPSSDFVAAGFVEGSKVYLGASGLEGLFYKNHDTPWVVEQVFQHSMTLSATDGSSFVQDTGSNYWAVVRPGTSPSGFAAIEMHLSGGEGPANVLITGNTVSNWIGHAIILAGDGNVVERNYLTKLLSFRFLSFSGCNHVIRRNVIRDSPNILHYSEAELGTLVHPAGTGWYDYQVAMLSGFTSTIALNTNIVVSENWFENIENQLGRIDDEELGTYGITYNNNVFIGVSSHFSGGRDHMRWVSNTFFRCSWDTGAGAHPLQLGGRPPAQRGYEISHNLFVACGPQGMKETETRGFYSVSTNAVDPVIEKNMVAGEELTGWMGKSSFAEGNGVNGGDPIFLSSDDPDGPDNIPFTSDDGLQVLPNSPAAVLGGGALGVYEPVANEPVAHFSIIKPIGWFEPTGGDYNPLWDEILATNRGSVRRPFDTPPFLGQLPVEVGFSAGGSLSGLAGLDGIDGITSYSWNFGDGTETSTISPEVLHVFDRPGDVVVRLTVTNAAGNSDSFRQRYRVGELYPQRRWGTIPSSPSGLKILSP